MTGKTYEHYQNIRTHIIYFESKVNGTLEDKYRNHDTFATIEHITLLTSYKYLHFILQILNVHNIFSRF